MPSRMKEDYTESESKTTLACSFLYQVFFIFWKRHSFNSMNISVDTTMIDGVNEANLSAGTL